MDLTEKNEKVSALRPYSTNAIRLLTKVNIINAGGKTYSIPSKEAVWAAQIQSIFTNNVKPEIIQHECAR